MKHFVFYDTEGIIRFTSSAACDSEQVEPDGMSALEVEVLPVGPAQVIDGEVVSYSIPATSLDELKYARRYAMKSARDAEMAAGFTSNALVYDSDQASQVAIQLAAMQALIAVINASAFSVDWTLADNSVETLDKTAMLAVASDLQVMLAAAEAKMQGCRTAIDEATNAAEVAAITWPA